MRPFIIIVVLLIASVSGSSCCAGVMVSQEQTPICAELTSVQAPPSDSDPFLHEHSCEWEMDAEQSEVDHEYRVVLNIFSIAPIVPKTGQFHALQSLSIAPFGLLPDRPS